MDCSITISTAPVGGPPLDQLAHDTTAERAFKAKQLKTKPAEPSKVELPIPSFPLDYSLFNKPERNPEMIAAENNFKKMLAETEAKKNRLEGLEAIIGVKADDIKDF